MATAGQVAAYRAAEVDAIIQGALQRAGRLGAAGVDLQARQAAQARQDAAELHLKTEAAARRAEAALSKITAANAAEAAARAEHAAQIETAMTALQPMPMALPAPQPPNPGPFFTGAARDPVIYADTISARQLDVWGVLNLAPGLGSGLMVNPMTTAGQIIYSTGAGVPTALNPGATNQVLTMQASGFPAWQNAVTGFPNPMSAPNDMIVGGSGGTATRLPSSGIVGAMLSLTSPVGAVGWGTGPLTSPGDLLYRDTSANILQRLAIGANGYVLTSNGTGPVWAPGGAGGGMPNVFTTTGDMVFANPTTNAVRLPIGSTNQVLTVVAGIPAWTSTTSTVINPSGDAMGIMDTNAINAANNAFLTAGTGGRIVLGPGTFYITAVTISAQTVSGTGGGNGVSLWGTGSSTTVKVVGNGTGISCHRTSGYGAQFGQAADMTTSSIKYFVLDGTVTTAGGIGLDWGDGWGYDIDLTVVNFTAANTIAVQEINRVFWTEKARVKLNLMNNLQPLVITRTSVGDHSHEYNQYELYVFIGTDASGTTMFNGVQVLGGTNWGGDVVFAYGNVSSLPAGWNLAANPIALFNFIGNDGTGDWSRMYAGEFHWKIEQNPGVPASGNYPYAFYFGSNQNAVKQSTGRIAYTGPGGAPSNINGGEFSFDGPILGDPALAGLSPGPPGSATTITGAPAFPGFGVIQQNYGPNQLVSVMGGGTTGVTISGNATGMSTGVFFVQAGASITVNGAGANPTVYSWVPACTSTY